MNSLKIMKTICILLSSQGILCDFNSSTSAAKRVNSDKKFEYGKKLPLVNDDPKFAFLVGFIERNGESYFENPLQNVNTISSPLVGDARCTYVGDATSKTQQGCGVCNTYAPNGKKADPQRYRLCQWGYNINWPFQYNEVNWGMNGLSGQNKKGSNLINDIGAFQANTNYFVTKEMWGKSPDKRFNFPLPAGPADASGCPYGDFTGDDHWHCGNYHIRNSQANAMSCMKGNDSGTFGFIKIKAYGYDCTGFPGTGPDMTPEEIQTNFP